MSEHTKRTFTIADDVLAQLDAEAENTGQFKSEIVERALREYLSGGRLDRVESKVDRILSEIEGGEGPSRDAGAKKENSEESSEADGDPSDPTSDAYLKQGPLEISGKQQKGTANRMYNFLILESDDDDRVSAEEVREAIAEIGGESDYYMDTYEPLLEARLSDRGWFWMPVGEIWYRDQETYLQILSNRWEGSKQELLGNEELLYAYEPEEKINRLKELLEIARGAGDNIVALGIDDEVEINNAIKKGEARLKKQKRKQKQREKQRSNSGRRGI